MTEIQIENTVGQQSDVNLEAPKSDVRRSTREQKKPKQIYEQAQPIKKKAPKKVKKDSPQMKEMNDEILQYKADLKVLESIGYPAIKIQEENIDNYFRAFHQQDEDKKQQDIQSFIMQFIKTWIPTQVGDQYELIKQRIQEIFIKHDINFDEAQIKENVLDKDFNVQQISMNPFNLNKDILKLNIIPQEVQKYQFQCVFRVFQLRQAKFKKHIYNRQVFENMQLIIKRIKQLKQIYDQLIKMQNEKISKTNTEGEIIEKYKKIKERLTTLSSFLDFQLPKKQIQKEPKPIKVKTPKPEIPEDQKVKKVKIEKIETQQVEQTTAKKPEKNILSYFKKQEKKQDFVIPSPPRQIQIETTQQEEQPQIDKGTFHPTGKKRSNQNILAYATKRQEESQQTVKNNKQFTEDQQYDFEQQLKNQRSLTIDDYVMIEEKQKQLVPDPRRIHIYIWDSYKEYKGFLFQGISDYIKPRAPFKQDETQINYDADSEEEVQELMAENLSKSGSESIEDDVLDPEDQKFFVQDGHLSDSEIQDEEERKNLKMLQQIQEQDSNLKKFIQGESLESDTMLQTYKIVFFQAAPIKCEVSDDEKPKIKKARKPKKDQLEGQLQISDMKKKVKELPKESEQNVEI